MPLTKFKMAPWLYVLVYNEVAAEIFTGDIRNEMRDSLTISL